jgi:hypothetical protein
MTPALEERTVRYIESVEAEYLPDEKTYWQHPPPIYHTTNDYSVNYNKAVNTDEPAIFKKPKKEGMIITVLLIVAATLIYLINKKEFGWIQILLLVLALLVVLPRLLENKDMIRVSREGIWVYKEDREIPWKQVVLTYIKEVREESSSYFFIVHYYDETLDDFRRIEIALDGLVSPAMFAAMIERFKRSPEDGKSVA